MIYEVDGDFYTLCDFMNSLNEDDFIYIRNNFTSKEYKTSLANCYGELKTENYIIQNVVNSFQAFRCLGKFVEVQFELGTIDTIIKDMESMRKLNDL